MNDELQNKPTHPSRATGARLPAWYPDWARQLADYYFAGTHCCFVLHGNVHDLFQAGDNEDAGHCGLREFLAVQLFGNWDVLLHYNVGQGLRPLAGGDVERFEAMINRLSPSYGEPASWPRDPDKVLALLNQMVDRNIVADSGKRISVAILFDYAQYLLPSGDANMLAPAQAARLVRVLGWAQNPYIKRTNIAFCFIADQLAELNDRIVTNPHVATIEVPLPQRDVRAGLIQSKLNADGKGLDGDFTAGQLADQSNGLTLVNLDVLLAGSRSRNQQLSRDEFRQLKKEMIERECGNLLEFIEPHHSLELVVGHEAAKKRLEQDAYWLREGRRELSPMGYLVCGPVGTGKSFLAECYAGSVGIPCVKLRNFRSKYVGETEANLQRIFTVLRSLGPVVVIIDEADAALGSRSTGGDSGTSGRIFSMIAQQMGDTRQRGKIIWMLLTCRPDLLPIDLKRQGRAEVHIPMFYPSNRFDAAVMFRVMAQKNGVKLHLKDLPFWDGSVKLSGADMESVLLYAWRDALRLGLDEIDVEHLNAAMEKFLPATQGLERELQELAAALECTDIEFLPEKWRDQLKRPGGRVELQNRFNEIHRLVS